MASRPAWPELAARNLERNLERVIHVRSHRVRSLVDGVLTATQDLGSACHLLAFEVEEPLGVQPVVPGQFVMLRGPWDTDPLLARAFSILSLSMGRLELVIQAVGRATRRLVSLPMGATVSVLGPLGNGFPPPGAEGSQVLVAGGVGLPPLLHQAEVAAAREVADPLTLIYGGRSREDLVLLDRVRESGVAIRACTEDGTFGARGLVTDVMPEVVESAASPVEVLACGPTGMLRAVKSLCEGAQVRAWLSLESEMACGVGVCRGCVVARPDASGYRCTCDEGPVFASEEVSL